MFPGSEGSNEPNRLVIQLQPDEGMKLHMTAKEPGPGGIRLRPVSLDLSYAETFEQRSPDAYERLLMDVVRGNPTLFMRRDEVEAAWTWVEPILERWARPGHAPRPYPAGTSGPSAADHADRARRPLLARDEDPPSNQADEPRRRRGDGPHHRAQPCRPDGLPRSASTRPPSAARPAAGWPARTSRTASRPRGPVDKEALRGNVKPNIAIVSAYNDMLSAHQPFESFPAQLKTAVIARRRHRPVRRRRARDVRRHHPGPRRHGAVAVQPRRDRDVHGDRALPRHVRRGPDARRLRQDRARAADRRALVRSPADDLRARRPDDLGAAQRREGRDPPAVRRGQGRPRGAARGRVRVLPLGRHLHLLRHRQLQPDADGGHGPAPAGRELREPGHPAARGAHRRGGRAGHRADHLGRGATRPSARSSTRRRSSTAAWRCWPPAARPTTPCTSWRSPAPPASP